ncbi:MAG: protein kinase, partial [Ktedonobacteraceae bacterium]|nr:protein kinase [Ktedonobacteraceae bacterium]
MSLSSPVFCSNCGAANSSQDTACFACQQQLHAPQNATSPQSLLRQRYRITRLLGQGGMGAVYQAEDSELGNRVVAIKEMNQRGLNQQEAAEATQAFKREALLLAGLMHHNLPRIYDHFNEQGRWYLVMDFIEGETLEDYLEHTPGNQLPIQEALAIALQICDVLNYLHTRQPPVIFRDLKPANVMRAPSGHLYLLDFGIARLFKPGQAKDTAALGSPGYAAPEQYGKAQTTPQTDIYSLGAMLHQMLTGNDPSTTPFVFAPLPAGYASLQALLDKMLQVNAMLRPASILQVRQELQSLAATQPAGRFLQPGTLQQATPAIQPTPSPRPRSARSASAIPPPQNAAILFKYSAHRSIVSSIAWSPKRYEIATASFDNSLHILNLVTRDTIRILHHNRNIWGTGRIHAISWSPDGYCIASAGDAKDVLIWSVQTGQTIFSYEGHHDHVTKLAWSPDGELIASASENIIHVWDARTGRFIIELDEHKNAVHKLAWSPDGTYLASASTGLDGTACIYDATLWDRGPGIRTVYRGHSGGLRSIAWSPDGQRVASAGNDGTVQIWDPLSGSLLLTYEGHSKTAHDITWSPDSQYIASASEDRTVQVWNAQSGDLIQVQRKHTAPVLTVTWSPDGQALASGG